MRLPFSHDRAAEWAAHAAEIGRVGTAVSAATAVAVVIAEAFRPGVVGAVLPLETVLGALAFFIVLSLLADAREKERYLAVTILLSAASAVIAYKTASAAFKIEGPATLWLVAAATATTAILLAAARHPEK